MTPYWIFKVLPIVKIEQPIEGAKTFYLRQSNLSTELGQFIRPEQQIALINQLKGYLG